MKTALRKLPVFCLLIILLTALPAVSQTILTEHEETNFEQYTSYESMMKFLLEIKSASDEMFLGTFGKSLHGRELPYAVFSRPYISKPWEALNSDKLIIMLSSHVHGGEKTLRESNMMLLREIAIPGTEANKLLDDLIIVVVPSINPDGGEAKPRPTRGNAHGIDMNRDYIKLEQPSLAQYVKNIIHVWNPPIFIDAHNGGSFPYNVTYQGPSNASSDPAITDICDNGIFPHIDKRMEEAGYKSWYYARGNKEQWNVGGYDPRIGRNYGGLINSIAILFESPGGQDKKIGAESGVVAFKAVLEYAAANAEKIKEITDSAKRETVSMGKNAEGDVVVQMEYGPEDYRVSYLIGEGRGDDRKIVEVKDALMMKKPVPLKTRPRPYAYVLNRESVKTVKMLLRHNIRVERLLKDVELEVSYYMLDSVSYSHEYDHPSSVTSHVGSVETKKMTFTKGSYVIQTGQSLGRVVTHMLEPETNDNVVKWNTLDYVLPQKYTPEEIERMNEWRRSRGRPPIGEVKTELPIYKIMTPQSLPTKAVGH